MKNLLATKFQTPILSITHYRYIFQSLAIMLSLILWTSCDSNINLPNTDTVLTTDSVNVAFAGGGWRAHAGHAAWIISLLDESDKNNKLTLNSAFTNVSSISSNSGGSWFSTMLMFSPKFVSDIQAPNAINTWSSTGWVGLQKQHFNKATYFDINSDSLKNSPCYTWFPSNTAFDACVLNHYTSELGTHWDQVVEGLVFKDYPLSKNSVFLNSKRQAWATDKPLLLAASMLTTEVVLNGSTHLDPYKNNYNYYQACLSPSKPQMNGVNGATCNGSRNQNGPLDVTPATFSSIPNHYYNTPLFLPEAGLSSDLNSPKFELGYTNTKGSQVGSFVQNPLAHESVPVIIAAAASSAAGGFEASHRVNGGEWIESWTAEDEALSFKLDNSNVKFQDAASLTVQSLASQKFVRIADGGPVDNSGVAQLVSFLQLNNKAINVVAFDNVTEAYTVPYHSNAAELGPDIANLFGRGLCNGKFCSSCPGGTCINVPDLQIFDTTAVVSTEMTWGTSAKNVNNKTQKLIYTKYNVTTIENPIYGIKGGTSGVLHAFTCVAPDATTVPQLLPTKGAGVDFRFYSGMLQFIYNGLQVEDSKGNKGISFLKDAFNLGN